MNYLFTPAPITTVPIAQTDKLFPVRHLYCVGRNYAEHALEMGHDPNKEPPFFFCKPADAIVIVHPNQTGQFPYPSMTSDCQFEVELVVALNKGGQKIAPEQALEHVYGYAVGLDMTRRDLQSNMKKLGRPWEIGKAFSASAPISPIYPKHMVGSLEQNEIWLDLNGQRQQTGKLSDMIWKVADTISYLSTLFTLEAGDLIYTGTPKGVGAIKQGDIMTAGIANITSINIAVI